MATDAGMLAAVRVWYVQHGLLPWSRASPRSQDHAGRRRTTASNAVLREPARLRHHVRGSEAAKACETGVNDRLYEGAPVLQDGANGLLVVRARCFGHPFPGAV